MEWGRGITNVDDFEICRGQRGGLATARGLLLLAAFEMKWQGKHFTTQTHLHGEPRLAMNSLPSLGWP